MVNIEDHLGLAKSFASRHAGLRGPAVSWEDLYQEACVGLVRAAETYDSSRGAFSTYAWYWMKRYVFRAADEAENGPLFISLDATATNAEGDEVSYHELVGREDPQFEWLDLYLAVDTLSVDERLFIIKRFGEAYTLSKIGFLLGVTKQRAHQMEGEILAKLRNAL